jgi:RNase P protein component
MEARKRQQHCSSLHQQCEVEEEAEQEENWMNRDLKKKQQDANKRSRKKRKNRWITGSWQVGISENCHLVIISSSHLPRVNH